MQAYFRSVRDSLVYLVIGLALAFLIFFGLRIGQAQQPVAPGSMPPPSCQGELATAKQYNTILLNNTTQYETSSRELWQKVQDLTKERDDALAKLKTLEAPKEPTPPATN
jgi:hypothetical protein